MTTTTQPALIDAVFAVIQSHLEISTSAIYTKLKADGIIPANANDKTAKNSISAACAALRERGLITSIPHPERAGVLLWQEANNVPASKQATPKPAPLGIPIESINQPTAAPPKNQPQPTAPAEFSDAIAELIADKVAARIVPIDREKLADALLAVQQAAEESVALARRAALQARTVEELVELIQHQFAAPTVQP